MSKVAIGVGDDTRWLGEEKDGGGFASGKVLWAGREERGRLKDPSANGLGGTIGSFPNIGRKESVSLNLEHGGAALSAVSPGRMFKSASLEGVVSMERSGETGRCGMPE